jgi:hypothetical protein
MRAFVNADTTAANNGGYIYSSGSWGRLRPYIQAGSVNSATDTNGYVNVIFPIQMSTPPTAVIVTNGPAVGGTTSQYSDLSLGQVNIQNFTVFSRNTTSGSALGSNPVKFHWLAVWL